MKGMVLALAGAFALTAVAAPARAQTIVLYARADARCVRPLTPLLRLHELTWIDVDGIPPGELWRERVAAAVIQANTALVMWSRSAAGSAEVAAEWRLALMSGSRVVPVLLDSTPLPEGLSERQAVDLRPMRCLR